MADSHLPLPGPHVPRRYSIFISYRHADNLEMGRKWATWLHETTENYEIPEDLAGKFNIRGESVPSSLYPVFRDEEELPADADLSANIRRALENSSMLVVICSPRAVQSKFVAEEIRYFKNLGKSNRILALIIDGEPNASDDPEKLDQSGVSLECFPKPLRYGVPDADGKVDWSTRAEPIAADCRPGGQPLQGWTTAAAYGESLARQPDLTKQQRAEAVREYADRLELARLKVIAGALGLPLGELTQRDKARQLRRAKQRSRLLLALSTVFAVLAGSAAVLGWMANERRKEADAQRREADAQRAEAETQRRQADTQRGAAEEARGIAEREKRQAVATLAVSDFQEGVNRLRETATARSGMAYLARAAGAGHEGAASRIWTLFQQRSYWLESPDPVPAPAPARQRMQEMIPPPQFETVDLNGERVEPTWYAASGDGKRCVTVVSRRGDGDGPITFRVWETSGRPLGPWHEVDFNGDYYLHDIASAVLSDDGRFVAVVATPWRQSRYLEVWDVDHGKRIGDPVVADGAQPDDQAGIFNDIWFTDTPENGPGPLLVTLSNRGNASVHRLDASADEGSFWTIATNAHQQSVIHAEIDPSTGLFISSSIDGSIQVWDLLEASPIGWPIPANGTVEALRIDAADRITIGLRGGDVAAWKLHRPPSLPVPAEELKTTDARGLHREWADEENAPEAPSIVVVDETGGRKLQVVNRVELQVIDAAGARLWTRSFPSPVAHARLHDENTVIAQTNFFTTEVWDVKANALKFPAIDETPLFTSVSADTVLLSSLSADNRFLLTRSFLWDPPNIGRYAFTVWDTATGKPITDRRISVDDAAADPAETLAENHAEFSADSRSLLIGNWSKDALSKPLAAVQLRPSSEVGPKLPALAGVLGGLRLTPEGTLEPVREKPEPVLEALPLK